MYQWVKALAAKQLEFDMWGSHGGERVTFCKLSSDFNRLVMGFLSSDSRFLCQSSSSAQAKLKKV